jgi:hypothetical protein
MERPCWTRISDPFELKGAGSMSAIPHGLSTTHKYQVNEDLLGFLKT